LTLLAVSILIKPDQGAPEACAAAARAAEHGADLVEYRVDHLADQPAAVLAILERSPLPCILTCRPTWEGGHHQGPESQRVALWRAMAHAARPPAYLDVELAAFQKSPELREATLAIVDHPGQIEPRRTGLILSSHDFETRPTDLYQRLEAMTAQPACRVIKIAWRARSLRDNCEALTLLAARHKPAIAICMGEAGLPSRVLAKKFGGLLTFASLDRESATAPGQPTLTELRRLYRWDALTPSTRVFGVIGHPVGHSKSPAIHNAGFEALNYPGVYLPLPIPPEYEHFKATLATWLDTPGLDFQGASVTIPHKENLLRFVREHPNPANEIEPLAARIGVANTLAIRPDGSLYAGNTDYAAALDAVCHSLDTDRQGLAGRRVAVLGAGGAARAVVAGFAHHGATVVVYNRTPEKAHEIASQFNRSGPDGTGRVVPARLEKLCDSCCEVYINCTPVGMHPHTDATPIPTPPSGHAWGPGTVVFDTIYNPARTLLLQQAADAGCTTIPGQEMFVRQAAAQFELWTGHPAPIQTFRRVLAEQLAPPPDNT
jgi:3-dehydroquinate dehydratase/shikimate dehydrogenase